MNDSDYFSTLVLHAAKHLKTTLDLEYVISDEAEWFELGEHRIDFEVIDAEQFSDYLLTLRAFVQRVRATNENLQIISTHSSWLSFTSAVDVGDNSFDAHIASDSLLSGDPAFDSRVLAAMIDAVLTAKIELERRLR